MTTPPSGPNAALRNDCAARVGQLRSVCPVLSVGGHPDLDRAVGSARSCGRRSAPTGSCHRRPASSARWARGDRVPGMPVGRPEAMTGVWKRGHIAAGAAQLREVRIQQLLRNVRVGLRPAGGRCSKARIPDAQATKPGPPGTMNDGAWLPAPRDRPMNPSEDTRSGRPDRPERTTAETCRWRRRWRGTPGFAQAPRSGLLPVDPQAGLGGRVTAAAAPGATGKEQEANADE